MRDFRELKVWEKSHQLTLAVYKTTTDFPREEVYGLTSQIRRACASIPTNIAEGCGRNSVIDFARFLHIAMGSASELEYQLLLAHDLGYLNHAVYTHLAADLTEIKRMLGAYIQRVKAEHK